MSWLKELEKKVGKVALAEKAPKPAAKRADPRAKVASTTREQPSTSRGPLIPHREEGQADCPEAVLRYRH